MFQPRDSGPFQGLMLIDTDSHWTEAVDLWTSRAPARYSDRVPQVRPDTDGLNYWWIDGTRMGRDGGVTFVRKNGDKIPYYSGDLLGGPRDDMHEAATHAKPRVRLLDEMGIYAQIIYPNILGFATPALVQTLDRELAYEIVKIYNDACAEFQAEGEGRLLPQAVLPFWDIENSVKESVRVKEPGLTGVTMAGERHLGGLPDLGIGWIPYVLERVDYEYREEFVGSTPPELPPAAEMFKKGVYATFWFEDAGPLRLIDAIGEDNVMWETDFPHPTSLYPSPVERSEQKLGELEPRVIRKIMQDSTAPLYKIPL